MSLVRSRQKSRLPVVDTEGAGSGSTETKERLSVAVFGAGVAGLTAAHELIERGFEVTVYEANDIGGGKSRSLPIAGTGVAGRKPFVAEHGFRFFPGYYQHIDHTMSRIPTRSGTVLDNLVPTSVTESLMADGAGWLAPTRLDGAGNIATLARLVLRFVNGEIDWVPSEEVLLFLEKIFTVATSCDSRRFGELENISWWDYVEAPQHSHAYQNYVVAGLTKSLVACQAERMSARSCGSIAGQIFQDIIRGCADRVLNGPTSEVWFDPWVRYLQSMGVRFVFGARLQRFSVAGEAITGAACLKAGSEIEVRADFFVTAIPAERLADVCDDELLAAAPRLRGLQSLELEWMSGIVYYLDRDIESADGHTFYLDSPWALTSITPHRFWRSSLDEYGDGTAKAMLSLCISDWNTLGELVQKPARLCSLAEIKAEVWHQVVAHSTGARRARLQAARWVACLLDPAVHPSSEGASNDERLLINTVGSWDCRPTTNCGLANLMIAGDFVRTNADTATMEAANESGRRAANALLDASQTSLPRAQVWALPEVAGIGALRRLDATRYDKGLPHVLDCENRVRATLRGLVREFLVASGARTTRTLGSFTTKIKDAIRPPRVRQNYDAGRVHEK